MWLASIGQLGGIVGGVGQALAISVPLTTAGREFNEYVDHRMRLQVAEHQLDRHRTLQARDFPVEGRQDEVGSALSAEVAELSAWVAEADTRFRERLGAERFAELGGKPPAPYDDRIWAAIVAVATAGVLVAGRYGLIQNFSTVMVCGFTCITILNLVLLQSNPSWAVTAGEVLQGLRFRLPDSQTAVATALATFGIIGVGAAEIVSYPYWCLEKGYARFTGPRDQSPEWAERARGWMRVMRWDAWLSMVVYTFATVAFYLLGAATLGRSRLNPADSEMIRTLAVMYEPVFGESARVLFLVGAFAVLYSTYFVANAAHARVFSDTLGVLGAAASDEAAHRRRVTWLSGIFPLLCLAIYVLFPKPAQLVLISGLMQALMLPMLAVAGLYFRFRRNDTRLEPGRVWDACLWVSAIGMSVAGIWALISKLQ
jgi:Mn2+/Fe2+ NRAMP family transporter